MAEDEGPLPERRLAIWAIGTAALAAWFAMLWFMFGDVI
jgi:hypothetical protein